MYAPKLYDLEVSRDTIQEFKGYNHNLRIADNEFFDMQNLTGKYYPVLSPRGKRGTYLKNTPVSGIIGKDKLVTIRDNTVYYGDEEIFTLTKEHKDRQLISMGAYVIIFPDMQYLNTADLTDYGSCYSEDVEYDNNTTLKLLGEDGADYNVLNAVWGEELFPTMDYYIDPIAKEDYALFGIPPDSAGLVFGDNYSVDYSLSNITIYGSAKYDGGNYSLFDISLGEYGNKTMLVPIKPTDYYQTELYNSKIEQLYNSTQSGGEVNLGELTINITVNNTLSFRRKVTLKLKQDIVFDEQSGRYKFYRTAIKIGDRRLWEEDGIIKSQICIKTEDSAQATHNTPSCWRDEHTKVRVKTNIAFVARLQKIFDNNESHLFKIASATTNSNPDAPTPLLAKYGEGTTNIARDNVTIVSGTEIDVLGYLGFYTTPLEGSISIYITPLDMKLDYLIECNNRLWGCRYGLNYKGDFVNEIYASERGSFRSFFKFDGTADDSYVLSLGSGGAFTGAATLGGMPVFFKEGYCHIISGSYPSTYHLTTETGTWVASGSSKSICLADSMLYFHGKDGIYVYDGASKQKISDALGNERYKNAVGGFAGGKYYVSMQNSAGEYNLFVFDQTTGMWHKEDSTQARFFAPYGGDLYMVVNDTILTVNGSQGVSEGAVEWYAETGKIGFATPDSKYIGKLQLKMILPVGSSLQVYVQYDSDGYWEYKGPVVGLNSVCFYLPIMPRKCDHFAIRLSGKGDCKIFSITKTYEAGGEM